MLITNLSLKFKKKWRIQYGGINVIKIGLILEKYGIDFKKSEIVFICERGDFMRNISYNLNTFIYVKNKKTLQYNGKKSNLLFCTVCNNDFLSSGSCLKSLISPSESPSGHWRSHLENCRFL